MRHNRETVLGWIGLSEGGYINHPNDNGGPTNKGITQRTYSAWLRKKGRPARDVLHITKAEADTIVFEEYMQPVRFDDLFDGLDYAVADMAVNSGVSRAAKTLQEALGFTGRAVDGIIGAQTLAAISTAPAARRRLLDAYADRRLAYAKSLKGKNGWATFGKGWTARYEGRLHGTQTNDIGVRDRAALLFDGATNVPAPKPVGPGKAPPPVAPESWWDRLVVWLFGR